MLVLTIIATLWSCVAGHSLEFASVLFPRGIADNETCSYCDNSLEMPLNLARKLNRIESIDEFLLEFENFTSVTGYGKDGQYQERLSADYESGIDPTFGNCDLTTTIVPVSDDIQDPFADNKYVPSCIRVQRCAGCCMAPGIDCQPEAVVVNHYKVIRFGKVRPYVYGARSSMTVPIEEHTSCSCDCIIKEKDCSDLLHYYSPGHCKCFCRDTAAQAACIENDLMAWDSTTCTCSCGFAADICSSGLKWSDTECKCVREKPQVPFLQIINPKRKHKDEPSN